LPPEAEYNLIYLDESQSFTPFQLFQILRLAKDYSMLIGFDRHQRLHGDRRNMQRFEALCHDRHIPLTHVTLNGSFRCPIRVIQLINNILSVKYTLAQGRPDKRLDVRIRHQVGLLLMMKGKIISHHDLQRL